MYLFILDIYFAIFREVEFISIHFLAYILHVHIQIKLCVAVHLTAAVHAKKKLNSLHFH